MRTLKALGVAVMLAVVLVGCSKSPDPTTTSTPETTTTTTTPTTTTTRVMGHDWVPAPVGDCDEDLSNIEEAMVAHSRAELEGSAYRDAFSTLLRSLLDECRTDVMERWAIETYRPWLEGAKVSQGRVPTNISEWPEEWREARSSGSKRDG